MFPQLTRQHCYQIIRKSSQERSFSLFELLLAGAYTRTVILPGVLVAAAIALVATFLAHFVPLIGAPVLAIVLGILLRLRVPLPRSLQPGFAFSSKTVLQSAIVVSGFGLSLAVVVRTG